jgi:hypothetical protein
MAEKMVIQLKRPLPAPGECLPHAAMKLGAPLGGLHPTPALVSRLVIQQQADNWVFYRLDDAGGFVGDSWHPTKDDALKQARREFADALPEELARG